VHGHGSRSLEKSGLANYELSRDWFILAQSEIELLSHRTVLLTHLESLDLMVNWTKSSLLPSQSVSFLEIELDSVAMTAHLMTQHTCHVRHLAVSFQ